MPREKLQPPVESPIRITVSAAPFGANADRPTRAHALYRTWLDSAFWDAGGRTCRDFLASYVNGKTENWLQGSACHNGNGHWEIHTLKPWRPS